MLTRKAFLVLIMTSLAACATAGPERPVRSVLVVGATGQTGRLVVEELTRQGYQVRAFVRDAEKARELLGDGVQLVTGEVQDQDSIGPAVQGMDAVISAIGARGAKGPDRPEMVDYQGVSNLAEAAAAAGVGQFVLVSSMGATQEDHPLNKMFGNVLIWKLKGENALRASGVPYTIVRPGGLVNEPAGQGRVVFVQGDPKTQGVIARADVAEVCVAALGNADALNKTLEIYRVPGEAAGDLRGAFAPLDPDPS
jgi:uncharacterized protein YbjT (DUF2867 family)